MFIHFFRSLYYFSYIQPKLATWNTGVIILVLMIVTAFTGYVLPWGQMSFRAATVITNLASAIPIFGSSVVVVVWGAYSISTVTLNRFYTVHFILPFIILAIVMLHFLLLHHVGSSNNMRTINKNDKIPFHPYYTIKDLLVVITAFCFYLSIINLSPNYLSHSDNYIRANPLSTPAHIIPEWYFSAFYAILRSVPDKLGGILALIGSILVLFVFPYFVKSFYKDNIWITIRLDDLRIWTNFYLYISLAKKLNPFLQRYLFWFFVIDFIGLSYIGMKPIEEPYLLYGFILTIGYYPYFFSSLYIHSFQLWLDLMKKFNKEFKWDIRFFIFSSKIFNKINSFIYFIKNTVWYKNFINEIKRTWIYSEIIVHIKQHSSYIFLKKKFIILMNNLKEKIEKYIANK